MKRHPLVRTLLTGVMVLAFAALPALAEPSPEELRETRRAKVREEVTAWDRHNSAQYGADAQYFLRPGLIADRKARRVTVRATATGMKGTEPVEFFLIAPGSSKAYEALAVSFAQASDVHAALEAIGLPPGRAVNYAKNWLWPRGERVKVTFGWEEASPDGVVSKRSARVEELLAVRETGKPLPLTGLAFVGGQWLPPEKEGGPKRYYADLGDPGSIASNYNDSTTVLDLPQLARQQAVYQTRIVNPAYPLSPGQALEITLEPDSPDVLRVTDVGVTVEGGPDLKSTTYTATLPKGEKLTDHTDLAGFVKSLTTLVPAREPFLALTPGDGLSLRTVQSLYKLLAALQTDNGIRLDPVAGHLFHEAFSPDESLRDYRKRLWQPVEIHLAKDGSATVREFEEKPLVAEGEERARPRDTKVGTPEELVKQVMESVEQRRPVAIYAPGEMRYGEMRKWVKGVGGDGVVVWVFLE